MDAVLLWIEGYALLLFAVALAVALEKQVRRGAWRWLLLFSLVGSGLAVSVLLAGTLTMRASLRGVFAPNPTPDGYIEQTRLPLVLRPRQFRCNAEDVADIASHVARLSPRYGEIRAPTAIVTGDSDGVVYAHIHSAGSARDIPGATLTVLEGVGHSPHYSAPEATLAAILAVEARARGADANPAPARASHPA